MLNVLSVFPKFSTRSRRRSVLKAVTSWKPKDSAAECPSRSRAMELRSKARSTRSSPAPIRLIGAAFAGQQGGIREDLRLALFMSMALICSGVRSGYASINNAAAPDTIGVAPEVPLKAASASPVAETAETDPPGAPISGLIAE